jgi:hypothetical protein
VNRNIARFATAEVARGCLADADLQRCCWLQHSRRALRLIAVPTFRASQHLLTVLRLLTMRMRRQQHQSITHPQSTCLVMPVSGHPDRRANAALSARAALLVHAVLGARVEVLVPLVQQV